jgi:hypothetical protein
VLSALVGLVFLVFAAFVIWVVIGHIGLFDKLGLLVIKFTHKFKGDEETDDEKY